MGLGISGYGGTRYRVPRQFLLSTGSETEKRKTWRVSCEIVSDEEDSGDEYAR